MCVFQFLGIFSSTLIPVCMADIGEYNSITNGAQARGLVFSIGGMAIQLSSVVGAALASYGMVLVGFGCVLLGGCPLRQLVLSGEGSSDSAVTVLGLIVGAAFAHNFGLASSAEGPTANGKIAVVIGLAAAAAIGCLNTFRKKA